MNNKTIRRAIFGGAILGGLGLMVGCGAGGEEIGDEFAEAIPTSEMLRLEAGDAGRGGQGLTLEQGLGTPSELKNHADAVVARVNGALEVTHARIEALIEGVEPREVARNGVTCKIWETDGDRAHWLLSSCERPARGEGFAFLLAGRPLASTSEDDYLPVFAGAGARLEAVEGRRRGAGRVGYNLDNLNALTGEGPTGKVGIGYRAAGRARQLNIGLKGFKAAGEERDISALYNFKKVEGVGGRLAFKVLTDFMTREGGELSRGQDGVDEFGRVALSFAQGKGARAAAVACGGSVGEGRCVGLHQCWAPSGEVTFEELAEGSEARPQWEETSCPALREALDAAPSEGDLSPAPEGEGGLPAPAVPGASADE